MGEAKQLGTHVLGSIMDNIQRMQRTQFHVADKICNQAGNEWFHGSE